MTYLQRLNRIITQLKRLERSTSEEVEAQINEAFFKLQEAKNVYVSNPDLITDEESEQPPVPVNAAQQAAR